MQFAVAAIIIVTGYLFSIYWLLRGESRTIHLVLIALCFLGSSLRIVYPTSYPAGLSEDEPKRLHCTGLAVERGQLFGRSCTGPPLLFGAVFENPLRQIFENDQWAVRSYSIFTGILAIAVAFAVARALGLGVVGSMATATLYAFLPWTLFFGRIDLGGELLLHQLLLLAALARTIWGRAGWAEFLIGSFGLSLLLYDYSAGTVMLGMPVLAAMLAKGWARLLCLAILLGAMIGYAPQLKSESQTSLVGRQLNRVNPDYQSDPIAATFKHLVKAFRSLALPKGLDAWFTVRSAGVHPPIILGLAILGSLWPLRRAFFLWGGLIGGMLPAILAAGLAPSTHRLMMALPFVALAAGSALDRVRPRQLRYATTVLVVFVAALQSVRFYYSDDFWPVKSRWQFDWERTALMEALPPAPHPKFIVANDISYFILPRSLKDKNYSYLSLDNWIPASGEAQLFILGMRHHDLAPFYSHLLGTEQVKTFGRTLLVETRGSTQWMQRHGWWYEARCPNQRRQMVLPTLYMQKIGFPGFYCTHRPTNHRWQARWEGPTTQVEISYSGKVKVRTSAGISKNGEGWEKVVRLRFDSGSKIEIDLETKTGWKGAHMVLRELTPAGKRIPRWEWLTPLIPDPGI